MGEGRVDDYIKRVIGLLRGSSLNSPVRIAVMLYLAGKGYAYFNELLEVTGATPGNLWSHLEKLEKQGMIRVRRVIKNRPRVLVEATSKGLGETLKLIRALRRILEEYGGD